MWIYREHELFFMNPFFLLYPASSTKVQGRLAGVFHDFKPQKAYFVSRQNAFSRIIVKNDYVASTNALNYALDFFAKNATTLFYYLYPFPFSAPNDIAGEGFKTFNVKANLSYLKTALETYQNKGFKVFIGYIDNRQPPPWKRGQVWFYRASKEENSLFLDDFNRLDKRFFIPLDGWEIKSIQAGATDSQILLVDYGSSNDRAIPAGKPLFLIAPATFLASNITARKRGKAWEFSLTIEFFP